MTAGHAEPAARPPCDPRIPGVRGIHAHARDFSLHLGERSSGADQRVFPGRSKALLNAYYAAAEHKAFACSITRRSPT